MDLNPFLLYWRIAERERRQVEQQSKRYRKEIDARILLADFLVGYDWTITRHKGYEASSAHLCGPETMVLRKPSVGA